MLCLPNCWGWHVRGGASFPSSCNFLDSSGGKVRFLHTKAPVSRQRPEFSIYPKLPDSYMFCPAPPPFLSKAWDDCPASPQLIGHSSRAQPPCQLLTNRPHIPSGKVSIILKMTCGVGPRLLSPTTPEEGGCPLLLLLLTTNSLMDRETDTRVLHVALNT